MNTEQKVLVLRFSSMGDVALTVPALRAVAQANPETEFVIATRRQFTSFFHDIPRTTVVGFNLKEEGVPTVFAQLRQLSPFDKVIDLHASLRSSAITLLFRAFGAPSFRVDKGRTERQEITTGKLRPLTHVVDRYLETFQLAGLNSNPTEGPWILPDLSHEKALNDFLEKSRCSGEKESKWIGFAPFAAHGQKVWPMKHTEELLARLKEQCAQSGRNTKVFLFGGGSDELAHLNRLQQSFPEFIVVGNNLSLEEEILLMSKLDVMLSMDSSNMHLAALVGTRVYSIWGATHPFAGFAPYKQSEDDWIQVSPEKLNCRPCSIYGNKPCARGDMACLNWIKPEDVYSKISNSL